MSPRAVVPMLVLAAMVVCHGVAAAQGGLPALRIELQATGLPLAFPVVSGADYAAGSVLATSPTEYTVESNRGPAGLTRRTTVHVRCGTPCPNSGSLSAERLQWRRGDQQNWTTLATTNQLVEERILTRRGANDPWSGTIHWRYLLDWTQVPALSSGTFPIIITLTLSAP
jgi:hypothetical protein